MVDGDLEISGQFEHEGLVIVKGDVVVTGGGQGTHIWGSLWVEGFLNYSSVIVSNRLLSMGPETVCLTLDGQMISISSTCFASPSPK